MNKLTRIFVLLSLLSVILCMSGCGSSQIYGKIKNISSERIIIETGRYERLQKGQEKQADPEEGAQFRSDEKEADYPLSKQINTAGLSEGSLVRLTLEDRTVTAIESVRSEPPSDEGKETADRTPKKKKSAVFRITGNRSKSANKSYDTSEADSSTVLVDNKGFLELKGSRLTKSGDSTDKTESRLHGLNSVLTASDGSKASIKDTTLTSSGSGASGIFATGASSRIRGEDIKVYTTGDDASGLCATYNGKMTLSDGSISTKGDSSAPVNVPQAGGSINVADTAAVSEGENSPCLYSAGMIRASNLTGSASSSPIAYLKGKSKVILDGCIMQGDGNNGVILSGTDSAYTKKGSPLFKAADSTLIATSEGAMFRAHGTSASVILQDTTLYADSNILAEAEVSAEKGKSAGSMLTVKGIRQKLSGRIKCDPHSKVYLKLTQGSQYKGAVDTENTALEASVALDKGSRWEVTGVSYLSKLSNEDKQCRNIRSNGYPVYYDAAKKANKWLCGKTLPLPGGGKLLPVK